MSNRDKKHLLRKELRAKRRALSWREQRVASEQLLHQVKGLTEFTRAKRIAFYLANDGELDPLSVLEYAESLGKLCYLPVIHPVYSNLMWFAPYQTGDALEPNRFGILEPIQERVNERCSPKTLDIVFTPLVGFDDKGNRMGMGGGFYDRTFAFLRETKTIKPLLVGIAHECQHVKELPTESWDMPLTAVITDNKIYR